MRCALTALIAMAGCGSSSTESDLAIPDLSAPRACDGGCCLRGCPDLSVPDLAIVDQSIVDLMPMPFDSPPPIQDMTRPDIAVVPPDLALELDMTTPPDLSQISDLAVPCDGGNSGGQSANSDVRCDNLGQVLCKSPKSICCKAGPVGAGACISGCDPCAQLRFYCDDSADCGRMGDICCVTNNGSECTSLANCNLMMGRLGCVVAQDCPQGQRCCGVGASPNYYCSPNICPISRRKYKEDIHYLDDREVGLLHDAIVNYPLTTWRYRQDVRHTPHLGFIIDDVAPSPAVSPGGETVDLYGYTSMAVAAIQEQQRQIAELRKQVRGLDRRLSRGKRR